MSAHRFVRRFFSAIARAFAFARAALGNLIVLIVAALALSVLIGIASGPNRPEVPDGGALLIAPEGAIVERRDMPSPLSLLANLSTEQTPVGDLIDAIEQAAEDDRIKTLVLNPSKLGAVAPAHLEVLGKTLETFRDSGKTIIAKGNYYGQSQYYLASFADEIYMHPMGEVGLQGFGMGGLYYRDLLEKLKVKVHIFRVGTFKAAVEPYMRNDMSAAAREANQAVVDDVWLHYVNKVAANRNLDAAAVLAYANRYDEFLAASDGDTAQAALRHGLVDELLAKEAVDARLRERTGGDKKIRHIDLDDYLTPRQPPLFGDMVAVITATGVIAMTDEPGLISADATVDLLRKARDDDAVKAVVLRVNSPGGSAFAAELIRQEVDEVRKHGKPVVVSMAGVAASGGYWISATADEIWASPTTITGSIGIFGIFPSFEDSLHGIGVNRDGVTTGPFAGGLNAFDGIDDAQARAIQASIDFGYKRFIDLVAQGRTMSFKEVDAIAQGRIWTGEQAQQLGLVDQLGHLEDAITSAAELADLESYKVRRIEKEVPAWQPIVEEMLKEAALDLPTRSLSGQMTGELMRELHFLSALDDPKHIYALCDSCRLR